MLFSWRCRGWLYPRDEHHHVRFFVPYSRWGTNLCGCEEVFPFNPAHLPQQFLKLLPAHRQSDTTDFIKRAGSISAFGWIRYWFKDCLLSLDDICDDCGRSLGFIALYIQWVYQGWVEFHLSSCFSNIFVPQRWVDGNGWNRRYFGIFVGNREKGGKELVLVNRIR